jgi:hypothetical protein
MAPKVKRHTFLQQLAGFAVDHSLREHDETVLRTSRVNWRQTGRAVEQDRLLLQRLEGTSNIQNVG